MRGRDSRQYLAPHQQILRWEFHWPFPGYQNWVAGYWEIVLGCSSTVAVLAALGVAAVAGWVTVQRAEQQGLLFAGRSSVADTALVVPAASFLGRI